MFFNGAASTGTGQKKFPHRPKFIFADMRSLVLILVLGTMTCFAQDDEDVETSGGLCNDDVDKKAVSYYKKGIDRKKYKKPERMENLMKALEIEPDFAEANLAMGMELAARSKLENKPFTHTFPYFMKAIALCPQVHSEPYYYIGFDYYERRMNDSAIHFLTKFIEFKDEDPKKFAKDWDAEMYQAKQMVLYAKKESALRKNVQFDPKVVEGVSTARDEYLAYISPDDRSCYFVRRLPVKRMDQVYQSDQEAEVFMVAKRGADGKFTSGEPMSPPFNTTRDNQGGCSISLDNKHLYFAMMRMEGGMQPNCDLYVCDEIYEGEWSDMRKLSANVNDPKYWDSQPTIASDGVTLYFASDRPGGYGGIDLWVTRKDPVTGDWSIPANLGPKVNTPGDEKTPFIHSDSETLYFSSTGHMGFGGYDIFYVRKDPKGEWLEPVNIGSPINADGDDTGFFVSTDTRTGYFFSYDEGRVRGKGAGRYDLFHFELYKEARPGEVALVKGNIADDRGNPVNNAIVEVKDLKTRKTSLATVDSSSGTYMMAIKKDQNVVVTVKQDSLAFNSKVIRGSELPAFDSEPAVVNLEVKAAKNGGTFEIGDIQYNTNSAELFPESIVILEGFADYLKKNNDLKIEIRGHTDNVGNPKENEALSTSRAFTVKTTLEVLGISAARISARGLGAAQPVASNATEEGRAKNRRTEFRILN